MSARPVMVLALVLGSLGCEGGGATEALDAAPPPAPLPLATCAPGAWIEFEMECYCVGPLVTPECPTADCVPGDMLVLLEDGTRLDPMVRRSPSAGRFSASGGAALVDLGATRWYVDEDGRLVRDADGVLYVAEATCTAASLEISGVASYERAAPGFQRAILQAAQTGVWEDVTYEP